MLLLIRNLPSTTRYGELKAMLKNDCRLSSVILDSLEPDLTEGMRTLTKRVTVGIADEEDKNIVLRRLNGHNMGGHSLIVEEVKKQPKTRKQTKCPVNDPKNMQFNMLPKQNYNQPKYCQSSHNQSYGQSGYNRVDYDYNQMDTGKSRGSFNKKFNEKSPVKKNQNLGNYAQGSGNYNQGQGNYNQSGGNYDQGNYSSEQGSGGILENVSKLEPASPIIRNLEFVKLYDPPREDTANARQSGYGQALQHTEYDHPQRSLNVLTVHDVPHQGRYFNRGYEQANEESRDWNKSQFSQMERRRSPEPPRETNRGYRSLPELGDPQREYNRVPEPHSPKPRSGYGIEQRWDRNEQRGTYNTSETFRAFDDPNFSVWNRSEMLDTQQRGSDITEKPSIQTSRWNISVEPSARRGGSPRQESLSRDRYNRGPSFNDFRERSPHRRTNVGYSEQPYARGSDSTIAYGGPNRYDNHNQAPQNPSYYGKHVMEYENLNPSSSGDNEYQGSSFTKNQGNYWDRNQQGRPDNRRQNDKSLPPRAFHKRKLLKQDYDEPPMKKVADGKGYSHTKGGPLAHARNTRAGGIPATVAIQNKWSPKSNVKNFPQPKSSNAKSFGQPKPGNARSFVQPKPGNAKSLQRPKSGNVKNFGHPKSVNDKSFGRSKLDNQKSFGHPKPAYTWVPPPPKPNTVPQFAKADKGKEDPAKHQNMMEVSKDKSARSQAANTITRDMMKNFNFNLKDKRDKYTMNKMNKLIAAVRARIDKLLGGKLYSSGLVIIDLYRRKYDPEEDADFMNAAYSKPIGTLIEDISTPNKETAQAQSKFKNLLVPTLNEVQKNALDEEMDACVNLFKEGFDNPEDESEVALRNIMIRSGTMEYFRSVLRNNIKNRVLNITANLLLRVYADGKLPKKPELESFLKKYGVQHIKKSERSKMYIVQCSNFSGFDKLCDMAMATVAGVNVHFKPMHVGGAPLKVKRSAVVEQRIDFIQRQKNYKVLKEAAVTEKVANVAEEPAKKVASVANDANTDNDNIETENIDFTEEKFDEVFEDYGLTNYLEGDILLDDDIMQQEFGIQNENKVDEEKDDKNVIKKDKNVQEKAQKTTGAIEDIPSDDLAAKDMDSAEVIDEWQDAWSDVNNPEDLDVDDNIDINEEDLEDY